MDKMTILAVDDIKMNRDMLKISFKDDYNILEASNGADALELLKNNDVGLIITDIFMHPMNGYELMRAIRKMPEYEFTPIIAVTESDEASQNEALSAGADSFVCRPFVRGPLKQCVKIAMYKQELNKKYKELEVFKASEHEEIEQLQNRLKETLAERETTAEMYQFMMDQTDTLVTVVDADTFAVLYANQAAKDAVAINSPGIYVGNVCHSHVFGLKVPCDHCIVNHTEDGFYIAPDFEVYGRWYRSRFQRIKWHNRDAIMEFTRDITEQKENISLIEQQKSHQDNILDTIPAGILVFKFVEDGIKIVSANKSICEMMGFDRNKALGDALSNITSLTHPDDLDTVLDAAKTLSHEGANLEYEYRSFFSM